MQKNDESVKAVSEVLDYCPDTGDFYWKISTGGIAKGAKAGWEENSGYMAVRYKGVKCLSHRIAFYMMHGYLPEMVDHKDGNTTNNKIENLREATQAKNKWNMRIPSNNTSGVKGVHWNEDTNKWAAKISINGKQKWLGLYDDIELAELVVQEAREKYHGEFARHR